MSKSQLGFFGILMSAAAMGVSVMAQASNRSASTRAEG